MTRETLIARDARAGCFVCHGGEAAWFGNQVQGTAARHHDLTGHPTWCDAQMRVRYGRHGASGEQLDIEAAIAATKAAA